jgi:hypothetical protein
VDWLVKLTGDNYILDELSKSLITPESSIIKDNQEYFLKSIEFKKALDEGAVTKSANEILLRINGGCMLFLGGGMPIQINNVVRVNDDGTRSNYATFNVGTRFVVRAPILVLKSDGTVLEIRVADLVQSALKAAESKESIAKVLCLLGSNTYDWRILRNVYEIIKDDVLGPEQIKKNGWTTQEAIERFLGTVNDPRVLDKEALHGVPQRGKTNKKPITNPMSFNEAKSFVEGIIHAWLGF